MMEPLYILFSDAFSSVFGSTAIQMFVLTWFLFMIWYDLLEFTFS